MYWTSFLSIANCVGTGMLLMPSEVQTQAQNNFFSLAKKERKEAIQQRKKERDREGGRGRGASNRPKKKGKEKERESKTTSYCVCRVLVPTPFSPSLGPP
jgi:hypothetical protein